jgi:hypothetical protein
MTILVIIRIPILCLTVRIPKLRLTVRRLTIRIREIRFGDTLIISSVPRRDDSLMREYDQLKRGNFVRYWTKWKREKG